MSPCCSLDLSPQYPDTIWPEPMLVALIGPDAGSRRALAGILEKSRRADAVEFQSYPPEHSYLRALLDHPFDLILLELDSDPEAALELIEEAAGCGKAIMAYSEKADTKLTLRCLDAGASDCLLLPLDEGALTEAMDRTATILHPRAHRTKMSLVCPPTIGSAASDEDLLSVSPMMPESLPGNLRLGDDGALTAAVSDNSGEMETAPALNPEPLEQSAEREVIVPPSVDRPQDGRTSSSVQVLAENDGLFQQQSFNSSSIDSLPSSASQDLQAEDEMHEIAAAPGRPDVALAAKQGRIREFGVAEMHVADEALFQMFRLETEDAGERNKASGGWRIVALISACSIVLLLIALIALLHPGKHFMAMQGVQPWPEVTETQHKSDTQNVPSLTPLSQIMPLAEKGVPIGNGNPVSP